MEKIILKKPKEILGSDELVHDIPKYSDLLYLLNKNILLI
jgi:hypothetical protein